MFEVPGCFDFGEEAVDTDRGCHVGSQHLDGDVALVFQVAREIDGRHAAGAELAFEPIARREGGRQRRRNLAHGRILRRTVGPVDSARQGPEGIFVDRQHGTPREPG